LLCSCSSSVTTTLPRPKATKDILILGVGNILQGDDGIGIRVVEMLTQECLPSGVCVADAGTPGLELPLWLEGWERVIIIDAVHMGELPGTWRRFGPDEVRLIASDKALSLHELDLANGLALAQNLDMLPKEIIFYGMEPERIEWGQELSPAIEAALPGLLEDLKAELRKRE